MGPMKLMDMRRSEIVDVIKVDLEGILLELYFNIVGQKGESSFFLSIGDDAERILFDWRPGHTTLNDIKYENCSMTIIDWASLDTDLSKLVGNEIRDVLFGITVANNSSDRVIYYFRMLTDKNDFLFFNNGDEGRCTFDGIDEILKQDVYGVVWDQSPFLVRSST
jgi:hypothetical protein